MSLLAFFQPSAGATSEDSYLQLYSSFGLDETTISPGFSGAALFGAPRATLLDFRDRYFTCRQHDGKAFDWDGCPIVAEHHPTQPMLSSKASLSWIPLHARRPRSPYRIARIIVNAFTGMLFGDGRFPTFPSQDRDTQDFVEELIRATDLKAKMIQARNIGGANGTFCLSWWFDEGVPKVRVHTPRFVHVLEWADGDELEPAHVVEIHQFARMEYDQKTKKQGKVMYWQRRDWTTVADVVFLPKRCEEKEPTPWGIDRKKSFIHNDGYAHFVWGQNLPDDNTFDVDGQPDYAETYEQMDELDVLNSVHVKGTTKNLDPTLVLPIDPNDAGDVDVKKGSENALAVGVGGQATYLTLPSDVVNAGNTAVKAQREQVLETAQCVIPDPNQVAAAGTSSVALKMIYAPMLAKCDVLRGNYGKSLVRLLNQMLNSARDLLPDLSAGADAQRYIHEPKVDEEGNPVIDPDTGEPELEAVEYRLELEPRIVKEEQLDEEGNPTGEFFETEIQRNPGRGTIRCVWPPYFPLTEPERLAQTQTLQQAAGGKPVISQKTASSMFATSNNLDPGEEFALLRDEQATQAAQQSGMWPSAGGQSPLTEVETEPAVVEEEPPTEPPVEDTTQEP